LTPRSDRGDHVLGQFREGVLAPAPITPATLADHVAHIGGRRPNEQMRWPDARSVVTVVEHTQSARYWREGKLVGDAMSLMLATA